MKATPPVDLRRALVLNVDVQRAFGEEAASEKLRGLRPSEGDEVDKAARLSEAVYVAGGTVVVTKDWHNLPGTRLTSELRDERAKDEFEIYGEHAVAGSNDAELSGALEHAIQKLETAEGGARTIIPVDRFDQTQRRGSKRLIEVHKNTYDVTKRIDIDGTTKPHRGFVALLAEAQKNGIDTVIVTGKIAEVCVRAAIESIEALYPKLRIIAVEDAISALPAEAAKAIGLESKEGVLSAFARNGLEVTRADQLLPTGQQMLDGVSGL